MPMISKKCGTSPTASAV
nr:unnamed protein product [Callosobruchus analis]